MSDFHRHLFNWLDKLLFGNYVKPKYKFDILRVFAEQNQEFLSFLVKVFGQGLSKKLMARFEAGDLEGTLFHRGEMINKLRKYSLLNFPLLTVFSMIKFYYFEIRLYLLPPGMCCFFDVSSSHLIKESFGECKKVFLGEQVILNYGGTSRYSWLKFYFADVFPIVRKGGLVFIKTTERSKFISKNNIKLGVSNIGLLREILHSNKTNVIAGSGNLYVSDISE